MYQISYKKELLKRDSVDYHVILINNNRKPDMCLLEYGGFR